MKFTPSGDSVANCLVVLGIGLLAAAAWIIHPAAGLAVLGVSGIVVGIGIARNLT